MSETNDDRLDLEGIKFWWEHCGLLGNGAEKRFDWLIAEVERLEYAVEAMQDTANKDKVRHREQIESLQAELEQVKGERDQHQRQLNEELRESEILKAENAELKKEIEDRKSEYVHLEKQWTDEFSDLKQELIGKVVSESFEHHPRCRDAIDRREVKIKDLKQKLEVSEKRCISNHKENLAGIIDDIKSGKLFVEDFGPNLIKRALYALEQIL